MADADEDAIPRSTPAENALDPDYDPEDEGQDFRFLVSLSGTQTTLPKRGEKDFEPNQTKAQQNVLNASREAMHNALAVERVHMARYACVGVYLPDPDEWWHDTPTATTALGARCVVVEKFKGVHNRSVGKEDFRNWTWLLPEEALFLLERGSLDIRWPDEGQTTLIEKSLILEDDHESDADKLGTSNPSLRGDSNNTDTRIPGTANGSAVGKESKPKYLYTLKLGQLPMSLQGAYACLIGKSGLTLERYSVYAGLKRLGYVLQRAPTWVDEAAAPPNTDADNASGDRAGTSDSSLSLAERKNYISFSLVQRLVSWLFHTDQSLQFNTSRGPLIKPGIYRSYNDLFRALNLIPTIGPGNSHATASLASSIPSPKPPFTIDFTVLKPSSLIKYRKSSPPPQDFNVAVIDARTTSVPTQAQISHLLDSIPADPPMEGKRTEMKLKHGRHNVILAIVDCGVISYLRVSDMGFGEHGKIYEEKSRRATKGTGGGRGGRGGFRGRGRGGGRGGRGK